MPRALSRGRQSPSPANSRKDEDSLAVQLPARDMQGRGTESRAKVGPRRKLHGWGAMGKSVEIDANE
eukprot:CAMPEP_0204227464 /NCGR_PEP_ID=MMETSP0361-20130328/85722_1 /ASSEMBLY_ACC=CAM_ASM_000343 /TAXON_ID=268821 /ORGANISM="Scrippsiella Hangoei, Strain SHTV-5" /LENGTH=66 /DNA_ID=CAMNT_0051194947 /DNA_START=71 /DNA_END=268 /DNA_ORIENTATION=-